MKKKPVFVLAMMIVACSSFAQNVREFPGYRFTIDLIHVNNDQVKVELKTPAITKNTITYHLPKIVPGTYSIDDFGRYVDQFKAYDIKGDTLPVSKTDENSWKISNAD